jgi:hypothetical protein
VVLADQAVVEEITAVPLVVLVDLMETLDRRLPMLVALVQVLLLLFYFLQLVLLVVALQEAVRVVAWAVALMAVVVVLLQTLAVADYPLQALVVVVVPVDQVRLVDQALLVHYLFWQYKIGILWKTTTKHSQLLKTAL